MPESTSIRVVTPDDAAAIREIYAPFCESSAVTFEEQPPSVSEIKHRIKSTLETYPWVVYERTDETGSAEVIGYAYADTLRKRQAYQWVVELSVYIKKGHRTEGVGTELYHALFNLLKKQGIRDAYAVTTLPNAATVNFHNRLGFKRVVEFSEMGYTEGKWHNVAWWRYELLAKDTEPKPIVPFSTLREKYEIGMLLQGENR